MFAGANMKRVLIAEDDESLRRVFMRVLARVGYEVSEAIDGVDALEKCRLRAPDLVVTDLIMPRKEGCETIAQIRQLFPSVKIIAMSGGGRGNAVDYLKIVERFGTAEVLAKPFSGTELIEAVERVIGSAQPPLESQDPAQTPPQKPAG
jgi:CheY-like chemotaxis protein